MSCNVQVSVRVRPSNNKEITEGCQPCITVESVRNEIMVESKPFTFDAVFDQTSEQESIYEECALPLVDKIFAGFNATVLAYGQTGSGKTYTMGTDAKRTTLNSEDRGIVPRLAETIFQRASDIQHNCEFKIICSMLEIYEERVLDLLSDNKDELNIREGADGVFASGLTEHCVSNLEETIQWLEMGCNMRSQGETAMNASSSRSHAIFQIILCMTDKSSEGSSFTAKLNLVDLAGSERLSKTQATGARMNEGIKINGGLMALGRVINALTLGDKHVPYRNSKLCRLLQDSLGGNSHTVMIACVSPADSNSEESIGTLQYAAAAKKIKNKPRVNQNRSAQEVVNLKRKVQELTEEVMRYRSGISPTVNPETDRALRERNDRLEQQVCRNATELLKLMADKTKLMHRLADVENKFDTFRDKIGEVKEAINLEKANREGSETADCLDRFACLIDVAQSESAESNDNENDISAQSNEESDGNESQDDPMNEIVDQQNALQEMLDLVAETKLKERHLKNAEEQRLSLRLMKVPSDEESLALQKKIEALEKEKQQLQMELRKTAKMSKLCEERRMKLKTLEKELEEQKRRQKTLKDAQKMRDQAEQNCKKLASEVSDLKRARVVLAKQLREESQKFRKMETACTKKLNLMQAKERKQQADAVKTKTNFEQKLTVFRSKYDEAVKHSKRLQNLIDAQKKPQKGGMELRDSDIKKLVLSEFTLDVDMQKAQTMQNDLVNQRKEMTRELNLINRKIARETVKGQDGPPAKKRGLNDSSVESVETSIIAKLERERDDLQKEIELRNLQISELNGRLASFDVEAKGKMRWAAICSVHQAKTALRYLFELAVCEATERGLSMENANELAGRIVDLEREIMLNKHKNLTALNEWKHKQSEWQSESCKTTEDHRTVSISLMKHITALIAGQPLTDEVLLELRRAQQKLDLDDKLMNENAALNMELQKVRSNKSTKSKFFTAPTKTYYDNTKPRTMRRTRSDREVRAPIMFGRVVESTDIVNSEGESFVENEDMSDDDYMPQVAKAAKQLTSGSGCKCQSNCGAKCGCTKSDSFCSSKCGCISTCANREQLTNDQPNMNILNGTFDVRDERTAQGGNEDINATFDVNVGNGNEGTFDVAKANDGTFDVTNKRNATFELGERETNENELIMAKRLREGGISAFKRKKPVNGYFTDVRK